MKLRIGSRGSKLALWQAEHVGALLSGLGHQYEIRVIKTTGDKIQDVSLAQVGTKGMFTKEIEEALSANEIDLAVHSMKDVPTDIMPEFTLAATLEREDPRDAFLSVRYDSIAALPRHARVGSSSLRRQAQLKAMRPDVEVHPLRGNVDTRVRKLEGGEYDAILLAAAGVKRLGLERLVRARMEATEMLPAVGQGALAIEVRAGDTDVANIVRLLNHSHTESTVRCERALLRALGGGCQVPIAAHAVFLSPAEIELHALVARPDGTETVRYSARGEHPEPLGEEVARTLLARGAQGILEDVYMSVTTVPQQP